MPHFLDNPSSAPSDRRYGRVFATRRYPRLSGRCGWGVAGLARARPDLVGLGRSLRSEAEDASAAAIFSLERLQLLVRGQVYSGGRR